MLRSYVPPWKKAPFLRALAPLMLGIFLQWNFQLPIYVPWCVFGISTFVCISSFFFSNYGRYKLAVLSGVTVSIIFIALGSLVTWYKDIRHHGAWYGNHYQGFQSVVATLQEPPVEKLNSYKSVARVTAIQENNQFVRTAGLLIIYFQKDSALALDYGTRIIFSKAVQQTKNAGNPGGFNYSRYCLFQAITHQVFLKRGEYFVLRKKEQSLPRKILFTIEKKVIDILRRHIHGEKEKGLAEALLIGYKDDLDKNLIQAYTNTGVVHVIAISGLHLGLIYWLLLQILKPLRKTRHFKWLIPVTIISALWLFSLVAGGQPSVLRSATMFTCVVLGENLSRKPSLYNTLAVSAFILLCVNPFWLWDVGFQLSYAAVLSIVIFMKPIYDLFYIKNRAVDFAWKLTAVSFAAQLLTTPFSIYHFHQFPNYFLLTNFIAVPLSSLILLAEIFLCTVSFTPFIAILTGKIATWLIWLMNSYIETIDSLPYALWDGLEITIAQSVFLIALVAGIAYWLLEKQKVGIWLGLLALLFFVFLRSISFYESNQQQKIIVYNVPRHQALDLISGRHYFFIGDTALLTDHFMINFNLKPSRILYRIAPTNHLANLTMNRHFLQYHQKRILMVDENLPVDSATVKMSIDLMIISKNPKVYIPALAKVFDIRQVVFDGSVSAWKLKYWIKDCDSLKIPHHNVSEKGAFVMNLN
jgi:competence protein ComEC